MWIVLLGAPGAGKGTQAEKIMKRLSIPTISTGNILRDIIAEGSELGKQVERHMQNGGFVPDDMVVELVRERIKKKDCENGCIFDGFPRTIAQAVELDKMVDIDCALLISALDSEIERRMVGRRFCFNCGKSYHITDNPPQSEGICDRCGAKLSTREDDAAETVRQRLKLYHTRTEPLIGYYSEKGKLRTVKADRQLEKTTEQTMRALGLDTETDSVDMPGKLEAED